MNLRLIVFSIFFFAFCQVGLAFEYKINKHPVNKAEAPYFTLDQDGHIYISYYDLNNTLHLIKDNKELASFGSKEMPGNFSWVGTISKDELLVIWRPKFSKTGEKYIYAQHIIGNSIISNPIVLNNSKDALPPICVYREANQVFVAWVDERDSYRTYLNYSLDAGKTFLGEINMSRNYIGNRMAMVEYQGILYFFFVGKEPKDLTTDSAIYYSTLKNKKVEGPLRIAYTIDWAPSSIKTIKTSKGPLVFWSGVNGIWYAFLDKDKWIVHRLPQTQDMNVNRMEIAQENDNIYLVTSFSKRFERVKKPSVFFFKSSDGGHNWSKPIKLNKNKFENTMAVGPDITILSNGTIVVVWEDHRLIRGNIYMNYSKDKGETWLEQDINLEDCPGEFYTFYPMLRSKENKFYLLMPRYRGDLIRSPIDLYLKEVDFDEFK